MNPLNHELIIYIAHKYKIVNKETNHRGDDHVKHLPIQVFVLFFIQQIFDP